VLSEDGANLCAVPVSTHDASACATVDKPGDSRARRLGAGAVGSLDSCQSSVPGYAGVYDLCGNVNEWIDASESDLPDSFCSLRGGSVVGMVDCALNGVGNRQMMQDNIGFRRCSD
jgi:hypothetical protein